LDGGNHDITGYLSPIMATLYRCTNDDDVKIKKAYGEVDGGDEDEVHTLANEVLDMIKARIGSDVFLDSYNQVRATVLSQRKDRKQQRSIMVRLALFNI
jgi:U3 small nucleolar RNA-associated protein 20